MSDEFTPGDATDVAHKCTIATTLNNHPLAPDETLGQYGVSTSEQLLLIKTRIRTNHDFGLPHHGRSIDPNALKDIDNDTKIATLSNIIFDESFDQAFALPLPERAFRLQSDKRPPSSASALSGTAAAIVKFTRQNPVEALVLSAAAGMLLGLLIGGIRR